tara:strand:- start:277 stop:1857 length:1581 start_codon:yes stop_codon:yes gene_type:complete
MAFNVYLDGFRPFGFHVINLTLHIFNSILIFFIFKKSFFHFKNQVKGKHRSIAIPFFASVIFLVHPIQTEAVIYIISRSEILASTFYLLGFFLFQLSLDINSKKQILKIILLWFAIISLVVLGYSVKQTLATFPLIVFLYYLSACPLESLIIKFLLKWKRVITSTIILSLSLLLYKLLSDETFLIGPSNPDEMVGRAKYMLSQPAVVIFYYLNKFVFPINLNIDPDIEVITKLFSFGFISGIGSIAFLFYFFWKRENWRFYIFFLLWFFIILSPSSSIVTLHDLAAEHRVYLALPGVIFIFSYGLLQFLNCLYKNSPTTSSYMGILFLFGITILLGVLSIERNKVWKTELTLWKDSYRKSPKKFRPLINLARAYSMDGNNVYAIRYYEESISKSSGIFVPNYNLGELYFNEGRVEEAIASFKSAVNINPNIPETYAKLGEIYFSQKKWELADIYFKKCIELDSRFPEVFKNLGLLHFYHLKNLKESLFYFSRSLTLDPNQKDSREIQKLIGFYEKGMVKSLPDKVP